MNQWLALLGFLVAAFAAAGIGGALQGADVQQFYTGLDLRPWAPPPWLFGPVWSILYAFIAVAAWLAWREAGWTTALTLWAVQLAVNALWSPTFFGMRNASLSLVVIVVLVVLVGWTVVAMARHSPVAGGLMVAYLLWVAFATALNTAIWLDNPALR